MNLDNFLDAVDGCSSMKEFKKRIGMDGYRSLDVIIAVLFACVADRVKAVKHPAEFYADYARGHGGELGRKAGLLSNAMADFEEAFRDD